MKWRSIEDLNCLRCEVAQNFEGGFDRRAVVLDEKYLTLMLVDLNNYGNYRDYYYYYRLCLD